MRYLYLCLAAVVVWAVRTANRYTLKHFVSELVHTLKHPKRDDKFELSYAAWKVWSDFRQPVRVVWYGLQNLWAWVPLIWHDRDWDHSFLLDMWELKFRRMAHGFEHHSHHVGAERTAQHLRVAADLCRRIREDDYTAVPMARHNRKWGKSKMVSLETENPKLHEMRFVRRGVNNDRKARMEGEEFLRIMKAGEQQKAADLAFLSGIIRKHLLGWWD